MTLERSTLAALRFGLGFRPERTPAADAAGLLGALRAAAEAAPLVGEAEDAALWDSLEEVRAARKAARAAAKAGGGKARGEDEAAMEGGEMADPRGPVGAKGGGMERGVRTGEGGGAAERMLKAEARELRGEMQALQFAALGRAVAAPEGFGERMARFWANHLSVSSRSRIHATRVAGYEDQAIRPHIAGTYADMLKAAARHPAMLMYLDQDRSFGPNSRAGQRRGRGLNENLGREILELHTLGAGGPYRQADVQALAALLTGFSTHDGRYRYRRAMAEPGRFELLGQRYEGASEDATLRALEALAGHPATARHLARKLAVHFVSDDPPEALVAALEARWRDTGGDLAAVSEALLTHPAAWGPLGAKVRQPQEIVIAALRAVGAGPQDIGPGGAFGGRVTLGALREIGQSPHDAPGPDGWPEAAAAWITPAAMANRLQWASRMGRILAPDHDPRELARAALRDALHPETAKAIAWAAERWEGIALLLASPDFNRR